VPLQGAGVLRARGPGLVQLTDDLEPDVLQLTDSLHAPAQSWGPLTEAAMKLVLIALCLLVPTMAASQGRPDARRLSCAQATALVRSSGAVVIATGAYTYDRYVSGAQHCFRPQVTTPAWIGTADTGQCFVGYLCQDRATPPFGR